MWHDNSIALESGVGEPVRYVDSDAYLKVPLAAVRRGHLRS